MTPYIRFLFKAGEVGGRFIVLWYLGLRRVVLALLYMVGERFLQVLEETKTMLRSRMDTPRGRNDVVEPMIRAYQHGDLTFDHAFGATNSLITAGSETSAWALTAFVYCVANGPACLAKLVNELQSKFDSEDEICLAKTEKLAYLNACIKESMRLYPSVAEGLPRVVIKGGRVIAGKYIPEVVSLPSMFGITSLTLKADFAGQSIVSISVYAASHLCENFRKPFEFHPERFLGHKGSADDKLEAFQPFSVGPRSCVGRNYVAENAVSLSSDTRLFVLLLQCVISRL
ncbi:299a6416-6ea5-43ad-8129-e14900318111 [Sclerotinia trifoliorum]|uniref:299a6416-6ea5-43ad-8129-e14900318111 n=1 Tax=Sclerotinia trifoliorum TaxID=28548 RepID=A0A8H2ZL53_9HELO|nr:299a6416-6ea5-43ad-8129-e14900318111 [Sclerotinia trifoliorum]